MTKQFQQVKGESEEAFQSQVVELAIYTGWKVYHTHDSRRSAAGYPDLTMVRRGRVLFAELKKEDGETTPEQLEWLVALGAGYGVECYLWKPSEFEDIKAVLLREVMNFER